MLARHVSNTLSTLRTVNKTYERSFFYKSKDEKYTEIDPIFRTPVNVSYFIIGTQSVHSHLERKELAHKNQLK